MQNMQQQMDIRGRQEQLAIESINKEKAKRAKPMNAFAHPMYLSLSPKMQEHFKNSMVQSGVVNENGVGSIGAIQDWLKETETTSAGINNILKPVVEEKKAMLDNVVLQIAEERAKDTPNPKKIEALTAKRNQLAQDYNISSVNFTEALKNATKIEQEKLSQEGKIELEGLKQKVQGERELPEGYYSVGGDLYKDIGDGNLKLVPKDSNKDKRTNEIINFEYGVEHPEFLLEQKEKKEQEIKNKLNDKKFDKSSKLRKEYLAQSKEYTKVRDSYTRVIGSVDEPSAAGDLSLIFNYMKMLDPGSVVRESEFATAAATGSYGERLKAAGNRILAGERLSDSMRKDFVSKANVLYQGMKEQHDKRIENYTHIAEKNNLPIDEVVIDIKSPTKNTTNNTKDDMPVDLLKQYKIKYPNKTDEEIKTAWKKTQ